MAGLLMSALDVVVEEIEEISCTGTRSVPWLVFDIIIKRSLSVSPHFTRI